MVFYMLISNKDTHDKLSGYIGAAANEPANHIIASTYAPDAMFFLLHGKISRRAQFQYLPFVLVASAKSVRLPSRAGACKKKTGFACGTRPGPWAEARQPVVFDFALYIVSCLGRKGVLFVLFGYAELLVLRLKPKQLLRHS